MRPWPKVGGTQLIGMSMDAAKALSGQGWSGLQSDTWRRSRHSLHAAFRCIERPANPGVGTVGPDQGAEKEIKSDKSGPSADFSISLFFLS